MNRLLKTFATGTVAFGLAGVAACNAVRTSPSHSDPTPTPSPTPRYSSATYAAALRTASIKLRGKLPEAADLQAVFANGQPAYEQAVDKYLDPAQNPFLGPQLRSFYNAVFLMGSNVSVTVNNAAVTYNDDEPPNLAAYVALNDKPVTELLTANYCVGNNFAVYAAGTIVDGSAADATGCPSDGAPVDQRAGVISQKPFLAKFGTLNTVNMRRVSVIHQIFSCGIYPDSLDVPLQRTNDTTADPADMANTNPACATAGCPDNTGECDLPNNASRYYPCNNNDSAADTTDDYPDPSLGLVANDPSTPSARLSKKYQGKLKGVAGQECHDCHGSLNARRPVLVPYDVAGLYDPTRTTQDVEPPSVNGAQDYCGMAQAPGANNPADDIDPQSADCINGAQPVASYFGHDIHSLKELGAAIANEDRFLACMTRRHYDFVLGKSQGELGLQAAGGTEPIKLDPAVLAKYKPMYQASGWNTRELLRQVFKGEEFLSAQQ